MSRVADSINRDTTREGFFPQRDVSLLGTSSERTRPTKLIAFALPLACLPPLAFSASGVSAQTTSSPPDASPRHASPRVDPLLDTLRRLARRNDPVVEHFVPQSGVQTARGTRVLIRARPGTDESLKALEGVALQPREDGTMRHVGDVYPATLEWSPLERLDDVPGVIRVTAAVRPGLRRPLETTSRQIGAVRARRTLERGDGSGQTVAMLDAPVDILHPVLFRPDGGAYRWRDVDGDDRLRPGVDGADLDDNGRIDANERLRVLDGTTVRDFERGHIRNRDTELQTHRDWLFVDLNDNGRREAGSERGFSERDPAYGEPLFVVEDLDDDGHLDPGEYLIRLDTSKIRRITLDGGRRFRRGENLIEAAASMSTEHIMHGTAVAGIVVGGQADYHNRVGGAPGADLLVYGYTSNRRERADLHLRALDDARRRGADVFLDEWLNPFLRPLDGSTNLKRALDRARRDSNLPSIVPVGNLHRSAKHTVQRLEAGRGAFTFDIPEETTDDASEGYREVFGTSQWRASSSLEFTFERPDGRTVSVMSEPGTSDRRSLGSIDLHWSSDRTRRETRWVTFILSSSGDASLPSGTWHVRASALESSTSHRIYGRVTGGRAQWTGGIRWTRGSTSRRTTISFPATADTALGVGAHVGRRARGTSPVRKLRAYSARGSRLGGGRVVDVAAPDNPFAPLAAPRAFREQRGWKRGWFASFGGTSGAASHVAGAMALLGASSPGASPRRLESRLFEQAVRRNVSPALASPPASQWGWGGRRLVEESGDNRPPEARLRVRVRNDTVIFDASESTDPDGDPLEFRFDVTHNRTWETSWRRQDRYTYSLDRLDGDEATARLAVRDRAGRRDDTLATYARSELRGDAASCDRNETCVDSADARGDLRGGFGPG